MPTSKFRSSSALPFLLLTFAHALPVQADETTAEAGDILMETVTISALAIDEDAKLQSTPHSIVKGTELLRRGSSTLGESLNGLPGVYADTFGAGASRPVIRGQAAPRVSVLSDGSALLDASAISPDHAITADPLLATRIEVLRGPSALLYGGGAAGGVVNVLDGRIPATLPEKALQGFFALRGNTVANEQAGALGVDTRIADNLVLHIEHAQREADDYKAKSAATRRVEGSWSEGNNSSAGFSWVNERGYLGLAYGEQHDAYGLPGHEHQDCDLTGGVFSCSIGSHTHTSGDEPWIDLQQHRLDIRGEYADPMPGIENIKLRFNQSRYRHDEIDDNNISTSFFNKGNETRLEATHQAIGNGHGVIGLQISHSEFSTDGTEVFLPDNKTESRAVFIAEHYAFNEKWHGELGARKEWQALSPLADPQNRPAHRASTNSFSSALTWHFQPDYKLSLSLSRSQRLPQAQELYADGVHIATSTYECGLLSCPSLGVTNRVRPETSYNIGLNVGKSQGDATFDVGIYYNRINDYIHARTLNRINDFRLIHYTQTDANFTGAEASTSYRFDQGWIASASFDVVRAKELGSNEPLPRIPAARFSTQLEKSWLSLSASMEIVRVFEQGRITADEIATPAHTLLNAGLNYRMNGNNDTFLFLQGRNLLNQTVWNHSSFLANRIPEPGRNLTAGVRVAF